MIIFGDRRRIEPTRALLDSLGREADARRRLVDAGELAQGLLDAQFRAHGHVDDDSPLAAAVTTLLRACARARDVGEAIARLGALRLPETVELREPEGYAHYALYPEQYALAAKRWREGHDGDAIVIGLRSIGTSLGAVVAEQVGARELVTVRPVGHPFRRELSVSPRLASRILSAEHQHVLVVDEGPGLSGSSFGATATWLERRGVPPGRIHLFPSHRRGPGTSGSERDRALWSRASSHHASVDEAVLDRLLPRERKAIDGGASLKFVTSVDGEACVARFVGLGRSGAEKVDRARALSEAGFTPRLLGAHDGFLFEEHIAGATAREVPVEHVARYLAFRSARFPAKREAGSTAAALFEMTWHNLREAFGDAFARRIDPFASQLSELESQRRPVMVDGRLHRRKWRETSGGRLVKLDAHDHSAAHACVGAQDVLWDAVGAAVELGVDETALCARVRPDATFELRRFHRAAYLAFQLGLATMAGRTDDARRYAELAQRTC